LLHGKSHDIKTVFLVVADFDQVVIVKLKMDKDRKAILERKSRARQKLDKGKHTEESIMETS